MLTEIRENLIYDLNDFEANLTNFNNILVSSRILLEAFEKDLPYHDSLGYCFSYLNAYPHLSIKRNGYKLLQSKGLGILTNNELRNQITTLYEDRYPYLLTYEKERIVYNQGPLGNAMRPYLGKKKLPQNQMPQLLLAESNVSTLLDMGFFRNIRNYDQLKRDTDFHSMIKEVEIWSYSMGNNHDTVRGNVIELIKQIEAEL